MSEDKIRLLKTLECEKVNVTKMFSKRDYYLGYVINDPQIMLWKYQKLLRKSEYYYNRYKNRKGIKLLNMGIFLLYKRRKNILGNKLGVDIRENSIDSGLMLFHPNIIVNGHSRIGKNCKFHGNNCIGNNGKDGKTPVLGDNIDIGFGAIIIGDVEIADDVKIGAGAVVVKSIKEKGSVYMGVPATKKG